MAMTELVNDVRGDKVRKRLLIAITKEVVQNYNRYDDKGA
jgi:hypothetical protein